MMSQPAAAQESAMSKPHLSSREQVVDTMIGLTRLSYRERLQQMGFRIEAGVRCEQGLVLSAHRHGFGQMEKAA
jgi:hypothetical protein